MSIKNVVVVDDFEYKRGCIAGYMRDIFPEAKIHEFCAYGNALLFLTRKSRKDVLLNPSEWLVVTDMVMPMYEGEELEKDGGEMVLEELSRIGLKCPVIVESSNKLDADRLRRHYSNLLGTVVESHGVYTMPKYKSLVGKLQ